MTQNQNQVSEGKNQNYRKPPPGGRTGTTKGTGPYTALELCEPVTSSVYPILPVS